MMGIWIQVRFAFVGYRDFCDSQQFDVLNFTDYVENFRKFCANVSADGGGDGPEDVFGGLERAIALNWTTGQI